MNQIDNGRERQVLTEGLLEVEAFERGSTGVAELFAKIENLEGKEHERLLFNTSVNTMYDDPAGTIELFREHAPTEEFRTTKIVNVFKKWAKDDRAAAGGWLKEQPVSDERDLMIIQLIENLPKGQSSAASEWAREIGDEDLRAATLGKIE